MTETRWTYVTPADSPNRVLHLPGCRMMTETEKLGRVRAVESYDGRDPMTLGDLLCKHCQKRVDRLPKIKAKNTDFYSFPLDLCVTPDDVDWLIAQVEHLRTPYLGVPLL